MLRDKEELLEQLDEICVRGAERKGGRVTMGPEGVLWLMLYAVPDAEFERMVKVRMIWLIEGRNNG